MSDFADIFPTMDGRGPRGLSYGRLSMGMSWATVEAMRISHPAAPQWLTIPEDLNGVDPALWPTGASRDESGCLMIAGHRVADLVEAYASPLYIMDEEDFRRRARGFADHFQGWTVNYAGKAFLCRAVVRWVDEEGLNLDVCSGNELAVALAAGFPPQRIGMHGNNKSIDELESAIDVGVGRIVVDSFDEISRIEAIAAQRRTTVAVLVRVTTGVEAHTHEYIATSHEDQKFGFSIHSGQAMDALQACHDSEWIDLKGVHSHIGSQIFDLEGFQVAAHRTMELLAAFRARTSVNLEEVNLGGGFGIAYTEHDSPLSPIQLNHGLTRIVKQAITEYDLGPIHLAIEPGRAICGPAGVAVYTVGTIKKVDIGQGLERTYIGVDGGMSDNIRTALYHADYSAVLASRTSEAEPMLSRVVGKHCESGDILVHDVYLPADLRIGDLIAVPGAGAYARSMASNYNHALRPAVIAVTSDRAYPIVRRENLQDLLSLDVG